MRWALAAGKAPRELEQWTTGADIAEMMAFERLEPFGTLHEEQMHGAICALTANLHLKSGSQPRTAGHFFPALGKLLGIGQVIELKDKKAMSALIIERVLKFKAKKRD